MEIKFISGRNSDLQAMNMTSPTTQFAPTRRMGIYEPFHQMSVWEDAFRGDIMPSADACMVSHPNDRPDDKVNQHIS